MNVRRSIAFHATRLLKITGIIIGAMFLFASTILLWIGYSNAHAFTQTANSLFQRLNTMISSSPNALVYVVAGVAIAGIIGFGILYASLNYIPVGKGQLDWSEYFDDLPWKKQKSTKNQ